LPVTAGQQLGDGFWLKRVWHRAAAHVSHLRDRPPKRRVDPPGHVQIHQGRPQLRDLAPRRPVGQPPTLERDELAHISRRESLKLKPATTTHAMLQEDASHTLIAGDRRLRETPLEQQIAAILLEQTIDRHGTVDTSSNGATPIPIRYSSGNRTLEAAT
jgi:hypothetical protein